MFKPCISCKTPVIQSDWRFDGISMVPNMRKSKKWSVSELRFSSSLGLDLVLPLALESSDQLEDRLDFQNRANIEEQISQKWQKILGSSVTILIVDVYKAEGTGLGITLEGTIDVESGEEIGSHHYIRTVLPDGLIGSEGTLKSGDELLEVIDRIFHVSLRWTKCRSF